MTKDTSVFDPETGITFPDWDTLVDHLANEYVVVAIITDPRTKHPFPRVQGPYPDKVQATNAKARWRTKLRREQRKHAEYADHTFRLHIEPVWKDPRER